MSELLVVLWDTNPFEITFSHIGTGDEICKLIEQENNCAYKCCKEEFMTCIDEAISDKQTQTYYDKYHGILVGDPHKFALLGAELYIKKLCK